MRRRLLLLGLFVLGLSPRAWSDTILLTNGNVVEGAITAEDDKAVTIRIDLPPGEDGKPLSIEMQFDRQRIRKITRGEVRILSRPEKPLDYTPQPEAEPAPETVEAPAGKEKLFGGEGGEDKARERLFGGGPAGEGKNTGAGEKKGGIDPALQAQIRQHIETLAGTDARAIESAKARLAAVGKDATAEIARSLNSAIHTQRRYLIEALGEIKDKRSVTILINEMNGPRSQYARTEAAYAALKAVTGQSLPFDSTLSADKREPQIQAWVDWFQTVKEADEYSAQYDYKGEVVVIDAEQGKTEDLEVGKPPEKSWKPWLK